MILPGEKCRCVLLGKHGPEEAHDSSWWEIRSLPSFLIEESYHLKQSPYFSIWQKADSSKSFREAEPLGGVTASEIFAISGSAPILSPILLAHDNQTITGRGIGHADLSHEKSNSAEMTSIARRLRSVQGAAAAHWGARPRWSGCLALLTTAAAQSTPPV